MKFNEPYQPCWSATKILWPRSTRFWAGSRSTARLASCPEIAASAPGSGQQSTAAHRARAEVPRLELPLRLQLGVVRCRRSPTGEEYTLEQLRRHRAR